MNIVPILSTPIVEPGRLAPGLEQRATLGIGIGQRLPVVAAPKPRPDLRHLHQAVPEALAIDAEIVGGGGHEVLIDTIDTVTAGLGCLLTLNHDDA